MLTFLTSSELYAQSATVDAKAVPKLKEDHAYLKEKLKLSLHAEFGLAHTGASDKLNNFTQFYLPTIGWNFKKDFSLTASSEIKYASIDGTAGFPNRFYRSLITLTRSEVLSEKDDGVKLNLGFARRYFDQISYPAAYGNTRLIATFSKTIGNASLFIPVTYLQNDPKLTVDLGTWRHTLELTPDLSFKISDKLSLSINDDFLFTTPWNKNTVNRSTIGHESYGTANYQFSDMYSGYVQYHYVHSESFENNETSDNLGYILATGVNVAKNTSVSLEMGSVLFASSDKKIIADTWNKPNFTVLFDWAF